ncbi:MAG TPA: MFS transporter [Candidatus Limnocylindria bacterium]|nr:MFS transporter [Candidatus Limnocylindria bacterium]
MNVRRSDPRLVLALAWLAGFTLIDSGIVGLALPDIARDFDQPIGALAWVSTAFLLALAATLLAAGRLNDRYGSRVVLAAGAVAFLVTTAASGLAPTFEVLVVSRVAQGIAGGVLYTVSLAIAVTAFPADRRPWAISLYFTSGALGAVLGPIIGGLLTDLGGWRLVFFAQLPLPALVAFASLVLLPRNAGRRTAFDIPGVASASVFISAATFALLQLAIPGATLFAVASGALAAIALGAFVSVERRAAEPAVRLSIFANVRFVVATIAGAAAWFAITSSTVYPALYLQFGRGLSATDAGLLLLPAPLVSLVFFPFAGRAVSAIGLDRAMLIGLLLLAAPAALMLAWDGATPLWFVGVALLLGGIGIAVTLVSSASAALSEFAPTEAGTASAVFNSLRQLGAAMGVAVPAVAFEAVAHGSRTATAALGGSTAAFAVRLVLMMIPLVVLVAAWRPRFRRRAATA